MFDVHGIGYYESYQDINDKYQYASNQTSFASYGLPNVNLKDTTITNTNNINQQWLNNNFFGANVSLNYDDHNKWLINYGFSWNQYSDLHYGRIIWA